jgi:hypothetical protein
MAEEKTIEETVDEETPREPTEIRFTNKARQEYYERFSNIDSVDSVDGFEEYKEIPLEREIRRKGKWFFDEAKTEECGEENYFCLVSNLKVFRAVRTEQGYILITTLYKFDKGIRGYMNKKLERCKELDEELAIGTQWEKKVEEDQNGNK